MAEKTERLKRERATTGNVWVDSFRKVFSFDLRSLALFRIAIGSVLIADLILRFPTIREMYTWQGVLPAELAQNTYSLLSGQDVGNFVWSLHWLNDTYAFQVTMFGIAALFAGLMIVGKWTRLATIVSWILLVSLHVRNPIILTSGDYFLKLILFWSIFLPLGARWSLDARQQPGRYPNGQIASLATAGFLLQLIFMYFFTGFAKLNADWYSGDAMYYVLGLEIYVTEFGAQLVQYPGTVEGGLVGHVVCGSDFHLDLVIHSVEWSFPLPEHNCLLVVPYRDCFLHENRAVSLHLHDCLVAIVAAVILEVVRYAIGG